VEDGQHGGKTRTGGPVRDGKTGGNSATDEQGTIYDLPAARCPRYGYYLNSDEEVLVMTDAGLSSAEPPRPELHRVIGHLLGGKDAFAADRELAEKLERTSPSIRRLVRTHREFARSAARHLAGLGIRQVIAVEWGYPSAPYLRDAAREQDEAASLVYVSSDPVVLGHLTALACYGPAMAAVPGNFRDPGAVLANPDLWAVTDLSEPVTVLFPGILSFADAEKAQGIIAGFAAPLAPGSAIVVSCGFYPDLDEADEVAALYAPVARRRNHSVKDVESFFGGLTDLDGGPVIVADAERWPVPFRRWTVGQAKPTPGPHVLGGIGIKN
jgi:hypothetical protein